MDLKVQITITGRKNPITIGYRPHMVILEKQGDFFVKDIFGERKTIKPNETFEGVIEIIHPILFDEFKKNQIFLIYEGRKNVGIGKIIEII